MRINRLTIYNLVVQYEDERFVTFYRRSDNVKKLRITRRLYQYIFPGA